MSRLDKLFEAKNNTFKDYLVGAENSFLKDVTNALKKKVGSKVTFTVGSRAGRTDVISFKGVNKSDFEISGWFSYISNTPNGDIFSMEFNDAMFGRHKDTDLVGKPHEMSVDKAVNHFMNNFG